MVYEGDYSGNDQRDHQQDGFHIVFHRCDGERLQPFLEYPEDRAKFDFPERRKPQLRDHGNESALVYSRCKEFRNRYEYADDYAEEAADKLRHDLEIHLGLVQQLHTGEDDERDMTYQ